MNKFKISHLNRMKKADVYALCLKEFGNDTADIYAHYTKAEMVSDLMTIQTPEPTEANFTEPKQQFDLPFTGFYNTVHGDEPDNIINTDMDNAFFDNDVQVVGDLYDTIMNNHYGNTDWHGYRKAVSVEYARWLLSEVLNIPYDQLPFMSVDIHSPKEYNSKTDRIEIGLLEPLPELNARYFEANDLLQSTLDLIKESYTSRDGFISFINPNPTIEQVFSEPCYLTKAFFIYACHKLDIAADDEALSMIDDMFINHALEQGVYDEAYHANHSSNNAELLGYA